MNDSEISPNGPVFHHDPPGPPLTVVIADDQAMHTPEDHPLWLRQRTPFMEVPSRYLAEITERQAELAN